MASNDEEESLWINRPESKATHVEYKAPPPPANPVVRGLPLHYLSQLVAHSGFVQRILWSNAGFATLRNRPELEGVDARYEPIVIKTPDQAEARQINDAEYLSSLTAESWQSKQPPNPIFHSTLHYAEAYRSGSLTPLQVVEALLPLIRRDVANASPHSIAFLDTKVALVRKAAEESTARHRAGKPLSLLDGVPMAVKDEEDLAGYRKCLASRLDFTNKEDVTSYCVQKWLDAGAICMGKTTMHELGCDTTNLNTVFGTPRNPYSKHYYCGGSSGGSAYAVAAGLVPFALGNDGGGSVRIPAAYSGLFGLKTSHGRVSMRPTANLARSTGVPGPLAANMLDLELAYRIMAQPDILDRDASLFAPPGPTGESRKKQRKTLGIYTTWFDRADAAVQNLCQQALDHLTSHHDYEVVDISLPLVHEGQLAHAMTILAELASGIPSVAALTAPTKILISVAKQTTAVDFLQAQKLRSLIMQHLAHLYSTYPGMIIVTPTTPNAGWRINEADLKYGCSDGNTQIRNMEYAWLANFSGCPAISVPVGYVEAGEGRGKVPVGLMGMGEWCAEEGLIGFGYEVEKWLGERGRLRPETFVDVLELAKGAV